MKFMIVGKEQEIDSSIIPNEFIYDPENLFGTDSHEPNEAKFYYSGMGPVIFFRNLPIQWIVQNNMDSKE